MSQAVAMMSEGYLLKGSVRNLGADVSGSDIAVVHFNYASSAGLLGVLNLELHVLFRVVFRLYLLEVTDN